jgi:hypothetical protein
MIYAAVIRCLVISTRARLLGIKLLIDQSICNQNATPSAIKSIKSMLSVYWDQSIQVDLEMLIVLLVDDSARNTLSWPRGCPYAQGFDQLTQLQTPATVVIQILRPFMYYTHFSDHGLKLFFALVMRSYLQCWSDF